MKNLPYAETMNYWQTSQTHPDTWMEKTKKLIQSFGGKVIAEAYGNEPTSRRSAFMIAFEMQGDRFKVVWPVLPSRTRNERAAKVQAATLMYHDIKARLLTVTIFGARTVFFQNLLLPDGRTAAEVSVPELQRGIPAIFSQAQLDAGIIDGEIV